MVWCEKEQSTPFDYLEMEGLCFIIGNLWELGSPYNDFSGKKAPAIVFPSDKVIYEFGYESTAKEPIIMVTNDIGVKYYDTAKSALSDIRLQIPFADQRGLSCEVDYYVTKHYVTEIDSNRIQIKEVVNDLADGGRKVHYITLVYDNQKEQLVDIELESVIF